MTEDNEEWENEAKSSAQKEKWADKLSSQCGVSSAFLKDALKELNESCFADTKTAKDIIEELTLSCHMDEKELRKFVSEVSKNCPMDAKQLEKAVVGAKGKKDKAFQAIGKVGPRNVPEREGAR